MALQNGKETDSGRIANFQEAWPNAVSPLAAFRQHFVL
jgi:hypothetical protein